MLTVFSRGMILKVIKVLKVFRGKGKAAVCTDTLVQNPHGISTWRHKNIKLNHFPKVHEITCLNTTVSCNKKIIFKTPKSEASFLTKYLSKFQSCLYSNWSLGLQHRLLGRWHHSTIILHWQLWKLASKYPIHERMKERINAPKPPTEIPFQFLNDAGSHCT